MLLLPVLALALGAGTPAPTADITVTVADLRSTKGMVRACLVARADSFPNCAHDPQARRASVAAGAGATLYFRDVAPGRYAVALIHDENANGKADFTLGLMPREGFGFSRDAKLRMGPPRFTDAAFDLGEANRAETIKVRYLF